ncbi:hypothetical protein CC86DRAFT_393245 [Ophiobolus disseminans]|uniref:Heterokaryon incompatibility domain-containing protein n=1 Tax=Ophiobolus disseminans TaxID=1469910 RepID=A0A6A7A5H2_9PLEO|nr:hypothetical protein CC86DRAFT_393245 [Ophiobolus disseminans]
MLDTIPSLTVPSIYAQWHHTVARYSSRHLTQYTDTFPAVSGLASIVSTYLTNAGENAQYVAGMWSTSIRTDLAWCSTESHPNVDRKPVRHPTYIAPSWSWASVNGKIAFSSENRSGKDTDGDASAELHTPDLTATIEKWDMQLSTRDSFGPLASARLYLRAPVVDAILEYYSASSSYFLNGPGGGPAQRIGHMTFDVPPESEGFTVVRCIALFRIAECEHARYAKEPTCGVGLAVVPVKGEEGVYRRVGRVGCLRMRWFEGVGEEGVVLV